MEVTGVERRRQRRVEGKLRIVAELEQPEPTLPAWHDNTKSAGTCCGNWRRQVQRGTVAARTDLLFLPVRVIADAPVAELTLTSGLSSSSQQQAADATIEIAHLDGLTLRSDEMLAYRRCVVCWACYADDPGGAVETFKKSPATVAVIARWRGLDPRDIEIWLGDEARIGQKNKVTCRWARRGSRPSAPLDQRTASTYVFGAICPWDGKTVGLILTRCNTAIMNLHPAAITADVAPGRHAVLLLDQAGWHMSTKLHVPNTITIMALPPKCPELNPQENVWQYLRDNWLSNTYSQTGILCSTIAVMLGTNSKPNLGPSCPSDFVIELIGSD